MEHAIQPVSCFAGCPTSASPPQAEGRANRAAAPLPPPVPPDATTTSLGIGKGLPGIELSGLWVRGSSGRKPPGKLPQGARTPPSSLTRAADEAAAAARARPKPPSVPQVRRAPVRAQLQRPVPPPARPPMPTMPGKPVRPPAPSGGPKIVPPKR